MAKIWFHLIFCFLVIQAFPGDMRASVHIEPYFGKILNFSKASQTESSIEYERELDGVLYGARLGYGLLGFSAGVDFAASQFDAEVKKPLSNVASWKLSGQSTLSSVESTYFGLFINYDLPLLLRVWATYFPSVRYEFGSGDPLQNNKDLWKGTGFSVGLGYTGLPFLSLNYELRSFSFDEEFDNASDSTRELSLEHDSVEHFVGISIPMNFF